MHLVHAQTHLKLRRQNCVIKGFVYISRLQVFKNAFLMLKVDFMQEIRSQICAFLSQKWEIWIQKF